jgi:DNA-binding CsgD family transcriptional regulator
MFEDLATETNHLANLLTKDVTSSGSFDIRGDIWATTFGKLLDALPIPGMLLDESFNVAAVNQACGKITSRYESIHRTGFSGFFSFPSDGSNMRSILQEAFSTRKPRVVATPLRLEETEAVWCRMTLRSIRIGNERFLLVLIEDLSSEKKQLFLNEERQAELRRAQQELEKRVNERTAQLSRVNEDLDKEIAERRKAEQALKGAVSTIEGQLKELKEEVIVRLRLSLKPLIDQLKTEAVSESSRYLLQALDYHLANVFASLGSRPTGKLALLTPRETQVCNLIASGLTSKQIAEAMKVTVDAVYSHRLHIRKKLGLDLSGEPLATWLKLQYGL